jgi:hypothetical protein
VRYPNSIRELHRYRKFAAAAINLVNKSGTAVVCVSVCVCVCVCLSQKYLKVL